MMLEVDILKVAGHDVIHASPCECGDKSKHRTDPVIWCIWNNKTVDQGTQLESRLSRHLL